MSLSNFVVLGRVLMINVVDKWRRDVQFSGNRFVHVEFQIGCVLYVKVGTVTPRLRYGTLRILGYTTQGTAQHEGFQFCTFRISQ
jgi:hypothetical protein